MLAVNVIQEVAKMTDWLLGLSDPARYLLLTLAGLAAWVGVLALLKRAAQPSRVLAWSPAVAWGDVVRWRRRAFRRARHRNPWW